MAIVFTVGLALGTLAYRCGGTLLGIYSSDPEVIAYGLDRMKVICQIYFLCGMMDVAVGILRGMGYSIMPMLVSLAGACGLRIVWIFTVFVWKHSLFVLYLSYPITWIITLSVHLICFAIVWKRKKGVWATVKPHPDLKKRRNNMRLNKIQEALKIKNIIFTYTEEDNCGSLDFQFRGLRYHIWEFVDGVTWGVETNVYHAGKSEDITGDYEKEISELILSWPDMAIPG